MYLVRSSLAAALMFVSGVPVAHAASPLEIVNTFVNGCADVIEASRPGFMDGFRGASDSERVEMLYPEMEVYLGLSQKQLEDTVWNGPYENDDQPISQCYIRQALALKRNGGNLSAIGAPTSDALMAVPTQERSSSPSGAMSQSDIDACTREIQGKQIESQSWGGDVDDVSARLGQFQKELFEGRCAGHPEAEAYINGANRMLGDRDGGRGSAGATGNGKRSNVPEAHASHCLSPQKDGGVINTCDYAVEYIYCVVQPEPGSWAASFDCNQGKSGSWQVGPNSKAIMHTAGAQVAFFGCRYGPTLGKSEGVSPADFKYNPDGLPSGRCKEWGAP